VGDGREHQTIMKHTFTRDGIRYGKKTERGMQILALEQIAAWKRIKNVVTIISVLASLQLPFIATAAFA